MIKSTTVRIIIVCVLVYSSILGFIACDEETPEPIDITTSEALAGGDFNEWVDVTQGEVTFQRPSGEWWAGLNTLGFIGGPITATKTEDSYQGEYAIRLETKLWGDELSIPGIMASGYFDMEAPIGENLIIGKPFTQKPSSLNGFYKYLPATNDTLVIFVALTKYSSAEQMRDTIAQGEFVYSGNMPNYEPFSLDIEYSQDITPDSVHVILLSSVSGKEMRGHPGSVLFVDELSFTYE